MTSVKSLYCKEIKPVIWDYNIIQYRLPIDLLSLRLHAAKSVQETDMKQWYELIRTAFHQYHIGSAAWNCKEKAVVLRRKAAGSYAGNQGCFPAQ